MNMSEISNMASVEGGTEIEDNFMVSNENITRIICTKCVREGNVWNHDKKQSEAELIPSQKEEAEKTSDVELIPSEMVVAVRTSERVVTDRYEESSGYCWDKSKPDEQCDVDHEDIQNLMNCEKYDKLWVTYVNIFYYMYINHICNNSIM